MKKSFVPYPFFVDFCKKQNVKSFHDFRSLNRPNDIPSNPHVVYDEWQGWPIITGSCGPTRWLPFREAREYMRGLKLDGYRGWLAWIKSPARHWSIPANPYVVYGNEWTNWYDFLGTKWIAYPPAKMYAIGTEIFRAKTWTKKGLAEHGITKPRNIPFTIKRIYKRNWEGMRRFLGVHPLSFTKFIQWLNFQNFKKRKDFTSYLKEHPQKGITRFPDYHYPNQWKGWRHYKKVYQPKFRDNQ